MIVHDKVEQGSLEWFNLRLGRFGSTDAQSISANGKGLETLCYKKAAERETGIFEDDYTNPDLERGKEQEDTARSLYELQTGQFVTQVGYVELDEYTGGSPDGLVGDDGLIEIKCQKPSVYIKTRHSRKPDSKYMWQMQHLMYITDRKWCDFVVYNEHFEDLVIIRVERDEKKIQKIKDGLVEGIKKIKEISG